MAKLKVRWTQSATVQFGRMLTFYNVRNGNSRYSRTIVKMVSESLKLIAKFPQMYRTVDAEEIVNVRVFHCDYFLIYYKVCETEIIVEAVFDTRQNPQHFLTNSFITIAEVF